MNLLFLKRIIFIFCFIFVEFQLNTLLHIFYSFCSRLLVCKNNGFNPPVFHTFYLFLFSFFLFCLYPYPPPPLYIGASRSFPSRLFIIYSHPLSPMSVFLAVRLPPLLLLLCISCIVNSSQKHDKVSARVPCASLLCSPSYLLLSPRYRACLSLSRVLYSVFFLCVRKAKVN